MSIRQMIVRRLEKDRLAQVEATRRFEVSEVYDVEKRKSLLVLQKRFSLVVLETILTTVFALLWLGISYGCYNSMTASSFPEAYGHLAFFLVWAALGTIPAAKSWREIWAVWYGHAWTVDGEDGHIEHNGQLVATKEQVRYVRGWVGSGEGGKEYHLELVPQRGKPIYLFQAGSWEECSAMPNASPITPIFPSGLNNPCHPGPHQLGMGRPIFL